MKKTIFSVLLALTASASVYADAIGTVGSAGSTAAAIDTYQATCPSGHQVMSTSVLATNTPAQASNINTYFLVYFQTAAKGYDIKSGDTIPSPMIFNGYQYPLKNILYVRKDACTTANAASCIGAKSYKVIVNCHTVNYSTSTINPADAKAGLTLVGNQ